MHIVVINNNSVSAYFREFDTYLASQGITYTVMSGVEVLDPAYQPGVDDVFWIRQPGLKYPERKELYAKIQHHVVLNSITLTNPAIKEKRKQYEILADSKCSAYIPSATVHTAHDIEAVIQSGYISYPFILKPNLGTQGNGVYCVRSSEELDAIVIDKPYIMQTYIPNDGDYRIRVVGGYVIGMVQRCSATGGFLHNFSKGGNIFPVPSAYIGEVSKLAAQITGIFGLHIAGVDLMRHSETGKRYVLEINSIPARSSLPIVQGDAYIPLTKYLVDLTHSLIQKRLYLTQSTSLSVCIDSYYRTFWDKLGTYQFHYASRLYLWTGDDIYKDLCFSIREGYLMGETQDDVITSLIKKIEKGHIYKEKTGNHKIRTEYYHIYNAIFWYNRIFFVCLFAQTVCGYDVKTAIQAYIGVDHKSLRDTLSQDHTAIAYLSTHAINFFYLSAWFWDDVSYIQPEVYMTISQQSDLLDHANTKELILDIYMLTHCIIGASCFYSRHIVDEIGIYMQMIRRLEEIITTHYDRVNLDAKCEFLVCARMLGYTSHIYTRIMDEASASLSPMGNFIIDTHNDHAIKNHNIDPLSSEHRNVLYIMANTVPQFYGQIGFL